MAFCGKCGTQLPEGAAFCVGCGAPRADVPQPQQPAPQEMPQEVYQPEAASSEPMKTVAKRAGMGKWIALATIALVVVAAVVVVALNWDKIFKSDETLIRERIQAYEDACESGDYDAMLDCMDAATRSMMEASMGLMDGMFSDSLGGMGMTDMFGFASMLGDFLTIEIKNIEIDGDYATVTVEMFVSIFGMQQSSGEAELPMVKENGDWYIGGVDNMIADQLPGIYA